MYQFKDRTELVSFLKNQVMSTSDVAEFLGITRQAVKYLVEQKRIEPFFRKPTLFLKEEIEEKKEELKAKRKKYRPYDND